MSLCNVEGTHPLIWQKFPRIWQRSILIKVSVQCYANGARSCVQVLAICTEQVPAGRRVNFEGLALASNTILRQNTSDHAVNRLCLPFPLNDSEILENGLIIPLTRAALGSPAECAALGGMLPPPRANSRTGSRSEVGEAAIESSQRVLLKGS